MSAPTWTKPYYGVTHLNGLKVGWQITATEFLLTATVYVKPPGTFTSQDDATFMTIESAKEWGEQKARDLNLFAGAAT